MSLKKVQPIDIIGHVDDMDKVLKRLVKNPFINIVNAYNELKERVPLPQEEYEGFLKNREYSDNYDLDDVKYKLNTLLKIFELKPVNDDSFKNEEYDFKEDIKEINRIYEEVNEKYNRLLKINSEFEEIRKLEEYLFYMKNTSADFKELMGMKFIKFKVGKLLKYNMDKMKKNYENIPAVVFKLHEDKFKAVVLVLMPDAMEIEMKRVLESLNFEEYKFKMDGQSTIGEYAEALHRRNEEIKQSVNDLKAEILSAKDRYTGDILKYYSRLAVEYSILKYKSNIVRISDFFYIAGLVPKNKKYIIENELKPYDSRIIIRFEDGDKAVS